MLKKGTYLAAALRCITKTKANSKIAITTAIIIRAFCCQSNPSTPPCEPTWIGVAVGFWKGDVVVVGLDDEVGVVGIGVVGVGIEVVTVSLPMVIICMLLQLLSPSVTTLAV